MNKKAAALLIGATVVAGAIFYVLFIAKDITTWFYDEANEVPRPVLVQEPTKTLVARIGETTSENNIEVTPFEVIEDSRCPVDVQCIQAGTVRLLVHLRHPDNESSQTLTLNTPMVLPSGTVTLTEVSPLPNAGKTIDEEDYRFTISIIPVMK